MALKWMDGFETYGSAFQLGRKYASANVTGSSIEPGRAGYGKALVFDFPDTEFVTADLGNHATWTIGFAFRNNMEADFTVLELRDGSTSQVELRFDGASAKVFRVTRAATTLGTGTKVIANNAWYYVELKIVVNNSTGTVELRINETADIGPLTSQNTRQSVTNQANRVAWKRTAVSVATQLLRSDQYSLDDIYVCDGSGSANTTFLGDMKIEVLRPSGGGNTTQWTPSPASLSNYKAVSRNDGSYVYTSTTSNKDTYTFGDLSQITTSIAGIAVCINARNTAASASHTIKSVIRSAGTDYDASSAQTVNDIAYFQKMFLYEQDPGTSTVWTQSTVNAVEVGLKLIT